MPSETVSSRTLYIGSVVRPDGYNGAVATVHLCADPSGVMAVHGGGYYTIPNACWETSLERSILRAHVEGNAGARILP